jgi:hypothetical protein
VALLVLLAGMVAAPAQAGAATPTASFTLDGVLVTVGGPLVGTVGPFDAAPAGSALQSASATGEDPYTELTITAIPFGTANPEEPGMGVAEPGSAPSARAELQAFRDGQDAVHLGSPTALIFGAGVVGDANLVSLSLDSATPSPTVVVEWIADVGSRMWMLQDASQVAAGADSASLDAVETGLSDLTLGVVSPSLAAPSTLGAAISNGSEQPAPQVQPVQALTGITPVPTPSWWSGQCDTNDYSAASLELTGQAIASYPLSSDADWNGLVACGPRPYYNEGPDVSARFPGSDWGVLEWECVELSMRWMYEAWGVEPYPANGSGVVWNYASTKATHNPNGPDLEAIPNDGAGPLPQPGDVLSFGAATEVGHTAVVTNVNIDASGDGSVTILEQNASSTGWDSVPVTDGVLGGYDGGVSGWLHDPGYLPVTQVTASSYLMGHFSGPGEADLGAIVGGSTWVMQSTGSSLDPPTMWSTHASVGNGITLVGDVTGNGTDDLVTTGADGTWVSLSTGTGFEAQQQWSSQPFLGTQATLLADLTGNGREDLVAVNGNDVMVMLSTGSGFSAPVEWSSSAFWGSQTTLAADVTGDGMDDLIAVDGDATWVLPSTGSGFSQPEEWSTGALTGTEGTFAADLTGDGEADLIGLGASSVSVMLSTGTAFDAPTAWLNIPFHGSTATLIGDLTGPGQVSLVAIDGDVAWVMQATPTGFDRPRPWQIPD